jgi:isoleucyl-tRNA synthetase
MFTPVKSQARFSAQEEDVLSFWQENDIFAKSLSQRQGGEEFVFYDGPPFATGLPHYGHLLAGTIKDVIPRYQTMCGQYVDRVFGWDCHGLPVENEMEKSLGINSKNEIEEYGVDKFNEACRSIVLKYTAEWETVVNRMGRWVDFDNGYRTMDLDYMESIWWVFKQLWDKGLIYEGNKIMWYCPRCATPLSNFEVQQGYKEVQDPAVTVRFSLNGDENRYMLAWTTTPWTLSANLALTVGPDIDYVEVADGDDRYILAEARLDAYYRKEQPQIIKRHKGSELVGMTYEPLYDFFSHLRDEGAFRVISADFVTTDDGTGIVHTAPGFGEDDAEVGKANGLPAVCPIDETGCYTSEVPDYQGRFVKDCDSDIVAALKASGVLVHRSTYQHNYPHCWRCESPLLNKAISTWFVSVETVKPKMLAANEQIHWVPDHLQAGRFGKWLENARDWAISRNRYWGCPLPIWRNEESGEIEVFGSVAELEARCGQDVTDIHKHFVDDIVLAGESGELRRVPEVLDCWFESGSMPYAQRHYPFENRDWLEANFPADFIAEGLDQTRGWFYTLVVLGASLFDKPAFKNVIVNGLILAEDGAKMSKRLKNYPDPMHIIDTYGADALRLYMLSSAVVRGEDFRFSEQRGIDDQGRPTPDGVRETMRAVFIPLWNAYSFFVQYANADGWNPADADLSQLENPLDRWILSNLDGMVADVREAMDDYQLQPAATRFRGFLEDMTNWYIRRSRRRFWKSESDTDKQQAYSTLYEVLLTFCKTAAPFIPFMTETMYRNLRTDDMPESVHLCDFPAVRDTYRDTRLEERMARLRTAVSLGHYLRKQAEMKVKQTLAAAYLLSMDDDVRADLAAMQDVAADELNVKVVHVEANEEKLVHLSAKANFRKLGRELGKDMKLAAQAIEKLDASVISQLRMGGTSELELENGRVITLTEEDIELRRSEREGLAVANEGDITVALDLNITEELILDGYSKEFVRAIQELRKQLDLELSDRIEILYVGDERLAGVIAAFADYIGVETLALRLIRCDALSDTPIVTIGDMEVQISIRRVES